MVKLKGDEEYAGDGGEFQQLLEKRASQGLLEAYAVFAADQSMGGSFVVTDRGYYGLVPDIVREGDVCAAIYGTRAPFVLRSTNTANHYQVIGNIGITSRTLAHLGDIDCFLSLQDRGAENWEDWELPVQDIHLI